MDSLDCEPDEIIVTSTQNCISIYDSNATKMVKAYKVNKIAPKCLGLLGEEYFIGASKDTPHIKTWTVRDEKNNNLMLHPCGSVSALTTTSCGTYCVAAIMAEIYVWNVHSGEMLTKFTRHYQSVTCLRFSSDNSLFLSGGKDGNVLVWVFSRVVSVNQNPEQVKPLYTWNNHSKEVTDIFVGSMGVYSRVATSSADMTAKIYELDTGILLTTICFDVPLTSVVMDTLEYFIILGTQKGSIFKVNLYYEQPRELHNDNMDKEEIKDAHREAITCLSMSIVGDKFISTSTDGILKLWEVSSLFCLTSIISKDGPYLNAFFTPYLTPISTKLEPLFNVKLLERTFVPATSKQKFVSRPLKPRNQSLSLIHAGSSDGYYSLNVLAGTSDIQAAPSEAERQVGENIYQEIFRGETLNEVREINAQIYTYMLEHAISSMGPVRVLDENDMDES